MTDSADRLRARFREWEDDPESELYGVLLGVTEDIVRRMIEQKVRRSDLAGRLGTSRAYVTKLLDGQENMTLRTLVRVANALDMKVTTKLVPRERAAKPAPARVKPAVSPKKRARVAAAAGAPAKRAVMAARSKR
ncbi:MAG: helix-turn-helix transcriptional regulator [Chloroflexi bacterium]|nr:helix-turn-helix transcriptional regulator [Chloroflexota bacterium]